VAEHPAVRADRDGAAAMSGDDARQRRFHAPDTGPAALAAFELEVEIGMHVPHRRFDIGHIRHPAAEGPLAQVLVDRDLQAGALGERPQRLDGAEVGAGGQRIDAEFCQHWRQVRRL